MDSQRLLGLFGICFTAACLLSPLLGFNIKMPASVSAVEGSCVLVRCQTQKHSRVIWYKYQSMSWPVVYDGWNPDHVIWEFRGRTSVSGLSSEGNCTLRINNVRRADGITLFPYINPESDKYYKPTVEIKIESRTPPVLRGPESPVKEGEVFNISCSIQHSCPPSPPSVKWNGLSVKTPEVITQSTYAGMPVTVSTVSVTAARSLHRKEVHCAWSIDTSRRSKPFPLDISFLSIMKANSSCSDTGRTLRCVCWVEAHPVATVTWKLTGKPELLATEISTVTEKDSLMSSEVELGCEQRKHGPVLCEASNHYGTETHQLNLPAAGTPPVISGPESPVKEGEVFNISCSIQHSCTSSPPSIKWRGLSVKTSEVITKTTGARMWVTLYTVRITAARSLHSKEVHCLSHITNDKTIDSKPLTLNIVFLSIMLPDSSCSETGGTLRCVCWVEAHPVAMVTWKLMGAAELPGSVIPNITIKGNVMSSEVVLEGTLAEQGPLVCVANNSHSTETHQMTMESTAIHPSNHAIAPAGTVLACLFGILCVCGCIFYFHHTRYRSSNLTCLAMDNIVKRRQQSKLDVNISMVEDPEQNELISGNETDQSLNKTGLDDIYDDAGISDQSGLAVNPLPSRPLPELDRSTIMVPEPELDELLCENKTELQKSHSKLDVNTSVVEELEQNELISGNETDQNLNETGLDDIYDDVGISNQSGLAVDTLSLRPQSELGASCIMIQGAEQENPYDDNTTDESFCEMESVIYDNLW